MPIRRLEDTLTATTATIAGEDIAASTIPVKPHIQYGILCPAIAGKLLDGTTNHSGAYGTAQSDGKSYYYTDIKGSGPIKDPRIGAHFGSQRHKTRSLQLLEQETASNGKNIFSVDGREWFRAYSTGGGWNVQNHSGGNFIQSNTDCAGCYLEITGYFNDINFSTYTYNNRCDDIDVSVNGTLSVDGSTVLGGRTTTASPLGASGRYVDGGSFVNGGSTLSTSLGTTPAINTVRYEMKTGSSEYVVFSGIELITQDTTSTANKSKIQIPSQNVVSYGKKFSVSGTPHYNPFNGMSGAKTLAQLGDYIDTATSLGMDNWKAGTSNYYKPFNGGRVVKWVDSSGTIKTSVTMMPPNAQNISGTASNAVSNAHIQAGTNDDPINFDTTTIANATPLHEIAKSFYWREFGNGAANGGREANYADASMLRNVQDDIGYVMDDGLTSLAAKEIQATTSGVTQPGASTSAAYVIYTIIGTGFGLSDISGNHITVAQNLPYGTHIYKGTWSGDGTKMYIDGVEVEASTPNPLDRTEVHIYQPKKPPIPDDACIISDYMLMADFVVRGAGFGKISKGVRSCSASRDFWYDTTGVSFRTTSHGPVDSTNSTTGLPIATNSMSSGQNSTAKLPYFGTDFVITHYANRIGTVTEDLNSDVGTSASISTSTNQGATKHTGNNLAVNQFKSHMVDGQGGDELWLSTLEVATPTHTSSHYQPFETPTLQELVGGDRNMEQTNLIVSPDGKTWDEVTRDTSYIGKGVLSLGNDTGLIDYNVKVFWDECRGFFTDPGKYVHNFNKDFAIASDRVICLKDGMYRVYLASTQQSAGNQQLVYCNINDQPFITLYNTDTNWISGSISGQCHLKRGDWIWVQGGYWTNDNSWTYFTIDRI